MDKKDPIDAEIEELEMALAEQRKTESAARKATKLRRMRQELVDGGAYERAIEEHGISSLRKMAFPQVIDGLPTFVIVKAAPADHMRIFRSKTMKARIQKGGIPDLPTIDRAMGELGKACIVYPDADGIEAIKGHYPTIEKEAGSAAKDLATAEAEEEGN